MYPSISLHSKILLNDSCKCIVSLSCERRGHIPVVPVISNPSNQIYMTKVADFNWIAFIAHIHCASGASSRLDFILVVSTWCASQLGGSWQGT